ncbi:MAG: putative DNA alkylation repair enzyme [Berkelbacteria bacterium GW2011_GWE1_39_12]|uniref:Putative DNA alkylation repair enzyme n=1 Tax=Berkelbacteria bacterium GW2011_GWE1_39_12 TaxID=1618337 RepID=A0A0G4B1L3_9BACT|nr:MAG: putative DNA alkylation repair enzyme [Berkelbacteria bacterium GW2011_GWE1_39_12]
MAIKSSALNSEKIIKELKTYKNEKNVIGMARFGIGGKNVLGGPNIPTLRKMAKDIKKTVGESTHEIALELWESGIHEARILASMIDDPKKVTAKQMDSWIKDFDSWDVCDQVSMNLFDSTTIAFKKAAEWSMRKPEFEKRAGFALMAALANHDNKNNHNDELKKFLPIILREATDERNFIRKAVNWALRGIGKRNPELKKEAMKTAEEILKIDNKTAQWIAKDAIRELKSR